MRSDFVETPQCSDAVRCRSRWSSLVAPRQPLVERVLPLFLDDERPLVLLGLRAEDGQPVRRLGRLANSVELVASLEFELLPARIDLCRQFVALARVEPPVPAGATPARFPGGTPVRLAPAIAFGLAARVWMSVRCRRSRTRSASISRRRLDWCRAVRLVTGCLFAVAGPLPFDGPQAVVDLRKAAVDRLEHDSISVSRTLNRARPACSSAKACSCVTSSDDCSRYWSAASPNHNWRVAPRPAGIWPLSRLGCESC